MTYAVTGSTGGFGSLAITHLINLGVEPSSIIALVRNEAKASALKEKGVEVRIGNYDDKSSLVKAFAGVDKVLLVSGSEVGKRSSQHKNAIDAAKAAGVKQIVYTSITKADTSTNILAPEHKETEIALKESGLDYVLLRNNWYIDNYAADVQYAKESGVIASAAKDGKVVSAPKTEYAEAAAKALTTEGHSGKTYELNGSEAWDYSRFAEAVGNVLGRDVVYKEISIEEKTQNLIHAGLDEGFAGFYAALDGSIEEGTLDMQTKDLENLLGRKPASLEDSLKTLL